MSQSEASGSKWMTLILTGALVGCASAPTLHVDDVADLELSGPVLIQPGDKLAIVVAKQKDLSVKTTVGADGKVSVPKAGAIKVLGLTGAQAAARIATKLAGKLPDGETAKVQVRVNNDQIKVAVTGEVTQPSVVALPLGSGVLHALAAARGLTSFANRDRILVLRKSRRPSVPVRFSYRDLVSSPKSARFALQPGDVVLVE